MERQRTRSRRLSPIRIDAASASAYGRTNTGALAASAWLAARDLFPTTPRWSVEVALNTATRGEAFDLPPSDSRFAIEIYAEEWGFALRREHQVSWIRVTDVSFVHGRDDFHLLPRTPRLDAIGGLIRRIEVDFKIAFDRTAPLVRSSIGGEDVIAAWARNL